MIKECYDIRDRYLHEWVSEGEKYLHTDMKMSAVENHIMIGKALKMAHKACCIAKEMAGEDTEHHEMAYPKAAHSPVTMKTAV